MKIVITDGKTLSSCDLKWDSISDFGEVIYYDTTALNERIEHIGDADILIVNKTVIDETVLNSCHNLKMIAESATGYNNIDVEACKRHGVVVCNVPNYSSEAVIQHSYALLLEICNHVAHHSKTVYEKEWGIRGTFCYWDYPIIELSDLTMGIIGYGAIGKRSAQVAKALGMRVIVYNKERNIDEVDIESCSFDDVIRNSDVISLHCSLNNDNFHMINDKTLNMMKRSAILINTSRGGLVDDEALAKALNNDTIFAAGLDVVGLEPMVDDNPLLKAKNCFITPHIAWASLKARMRLYDRTYDNIKGFLLGKPINVIV